MNTIVELNVDLLSCHPRMYRHRFDTPLFQLAYLILHQRDQRSDYNANAVQQQRRDLKANGFSSTGWQERQCIMAFQNGGNDIFLKWPERIVLPILL
jgi:hypothetical protein